MRRKKRGMTNTVMRAWIPISVPVAPVVGVADGMSVTSIWATFSPLSLEVAVVEAIPMHRVAAVMHRHRW